METRGTAKHLVNPAQLFVISGPSGVGKNTLADAVCARRRAVRAMTATTRPPRAGERDGEDYIFVSESEFRQWLAEGRLLEHTQYLGHYYGTPAASVNEAAAEGSPVILTIDVDGALQIKRAWPGVTLIFVAPPSREELRRRLRQRGRDDEESIERRVRRAEEEYRFADQYDYRIVNDDLDRAAEEIVRIMSGGDRPDRGRS